MRFWATLFILAFPFIVRADILHLQDGSRYYGTLVSRDEREILFRITLDDGRSTVLKRFPAATVKAVERTARQKPPAEPRETPPAETADENPGQILQNALRELDAERLPAALRLLQQVVDRAPVEELLRLDEQTRKARGAGLAELLAQTRFQNALRRGKGNFKLAAVTPFEAAALGRLLAERQQTLSKKHFGAHTIVEWAADRAAYETLRSDAREMVGDARFVAALLGARLRFDPQLKEDRAERQRLSRSRDELVRFVAYVSSMPGYTGLKEDDDPADPAARAAEQLREEQLQAEREAMNDAAPEKTPAEKADPEEGAPASQPASAPAAPQAEKKRPEP